MDKGSKVEWKGTGLKGVVDAVSIDGRCALVRFPNERVVIGVAGLLEN